MALSINWRRTHHFRPIIIRRTINLPFSRMRLLYIKVLSAPSDEVLNWVVVSLMSRFSTDPRVDHMQKLLNVFSYIKCHLDSKLVFDAETRDWSHILFLQHDWQEFYPYAMEVLPPNAPKPQGWGRAIQMNKFCHAAHANDHVTRRSISGFAMFLQGAPILWYSKRQNTIESSTFCSEFVVLKIATWGSRRFMLPLTYDGHSPPGDCQYILWQWFRGE